MAELVAPNINFHWSWLAASREFDGAWRDGSGGEVSFDDMQDARHFQNYVHGLLSQAAADAPRPDGHVPCTYLWMVEDGCVLGFLAIRHELNDFLFNEGGHIGYSVRPSARRRGHAARALKDALPLARALGIGEVLVTCDESNAASRATIEGNGGRYEDSRNGTRRYWLTTRP